MQTALRCFSVMAVCLLVSVSGPMRDCAASQALNHECIKCHGRADHRSARGKPRHIDLSRFKQSVHAQHGIGCVSCHEGIIPVSTPSGTTHRRGVEPKCHECHTRVTEQHTKSIHSRVANRTCQSCHDPHYGVSFRDMSHDERKGVCIKCHDVSRTHRWLPQKDLHFKYLECTSCHAVDAMIGLLLFMVETDEESRARVLSYQRLKRFESHGKSLIETLDRDGSGVISQKEIQSFVKLLTDNGVPTARLEVRILVQCPVHNFSSRNDQARDCTLCHSRDARFYSTILLEVPEGEGKVGTVPVEKGILAYLGQKPIVGDFYLLGESKIRREDIDDLLEVAKRIGFKWVDIIGAALIVITLVAIGFHGFLMVVTRKLIKEPMTLKDQKLAPVSVRVWHFVHGLCVILLILTGFQLRLPDLFPIFANFLNAVNLHNLSGTVLVVDYVFWLGYFLWKREFTRRYYISPRSFFRETVGMLHYYGYLIFIGGHFPVEETSHTSYDPLERAFFLTVMLIFVPAQILTGLLLLKIYDLMPVITFLGGLRAVAAIHLLSGYMVIVSTIVHTYFHALKRYRMSRPR